LKKRNLSSTLLFIAFLSLGGFSIYKGNLIANSLEETPTPGRNVWLIGGGEYFIDTISGSYHHLVTDFTMVELNPKESDRVIVDGYEDAKRYLDIKIEDDTLFISRLLAGNDTSLVRANDDYPILTTVGASELRSITLRDQGTLSIPINPYGSDLDGTLRYKPEDWEKYVFRGNELDLYLKGSGLCEIFTEVKKLNVHILNKSKTVRTITSYVNNSSNPIITTSSGAYLSIQGKAERVNVIRPFGGVTVLGKSFQTDTLIVQSDFSKEGFDSGSISMHCTKYLAAHLGYNLDVEYYGDPEVVTSAKGYGRVIKMKD